MYDPADAGQYLGYTSTDSVRACVGGPIIALHYPGRPATATVEEDVYLAYLPDARRWQELRHVLRTTVGIARDKPIDDTLSRLLDNGYTAQTLRAELRERLPQADPVGRSEIATRLGIQADAVDEWTRRHASFLAPRHPSVSGRPAWEWLEVAAWLTATGRPVSRQQRRTAPARFGRSAAYHDKRAIYTEPPSTSPR